MANAQTADAPRLDPRKFRDPRRTAKGETRATVALSALRTLWFNTGTLCNITCRNCYIESGPRNDRLAYLTLAEVVGYLDEIVRDGLPTTEIGFTGGEPFLNPEFCDMVDVALARGFHALVLTNAMKPMWLKRAPLLETGRRFGAMLTIRVSLDHYSQALHEIERGPKGWAPTVAGIDWLVREGFRVAIAGRLCWGESEADARRGYARLFAERGWTIDAGDPAALVLFPEMDAEVDVPEITTACWGILKKSPDAMMCASSRMVVKRRDAEAPAVVSCTLLPYDRQFELGGTLAEAAGAVALNHPHCAKFCVLGGASCSGG